MTGGTKLRCYMFGVLLGIILHMLYLDAIQVYQFYIFEECPYGDETTADGKSTCLMYGNSLFDRFPGKYFNIAPLLPWERVDIEWRLQ